MMSLPSAAGELGRVAAEGLGGHLQPFIQALEAGA
jgi:hypothetical protein